MLVVIDRCWLACAEIQDPEGMESSGKTPSGNLLLLTWSQKKLDNMHKLQPPSALALTGNLAENWRRFKQQFEIYEIASGLARKDGKFRAMTLPHVAGSEALEVYNTFQWDEDDDNTKVVKIMEKFERYCNPRKNLTFERHSFFFKESTEG